MLAKRWLGLLRVNSVDAVSIVAGLFGNSLVDGLCGLAVADGAASLAVGVVKTTVKMAGAVVDAAIPDAKVGKDSE